MGDKLKTLSAADPAIDTASMTAREMREWAETRDMSKVRLLPGSNPVVFVLGDISHRLMVGWVMTAGSEEERAMRAFRCAVERVENLPSVDGPVLPVWEPPRQNGVMDEEALDRFAPVEISEIGGVAFARSFFGRRTQPLYRLPPLLASHLAGKTFRPADANPNSVATTSDAASLSQEASP